MKIWLPFVGRVDAKKALVNTLFIFGSVGRATVTNGTTGNSTLSSTGQGPIGSDALIQFKPGLPVNGTNLCVGELYCTQYFFQNENTSQVISRGRSYVLNADDHQRYETAANCMGTATSTIKNLLASAKSTLFGKQKCTVTNTVNSASGIDLSQGCNGVDPGVVAIEHDMTEMSSDGCKLVTTHLASVQACMQSQLDNLFTAGDCSSNSDQNSSSGVWLIWFLCASSLITSAGAILRRRFNQQNNNRISDLPPAPAPTEQKAERVARTSKLITPAAITMEVLPHVPDRNTPKNISHEPAERYGSTASSGVELQRTAVGQVRLQDPAAASGIEQQGPAAAAVNADPAQHDHPINDNTISPGLRFSV